LESEKSKLKVSVIFDFATNINAYKSHDIQEITEVPRFVVLEFA